jgi:hypothetical protein
MTPERILRFTRIWLICVALMFTAAVAVYLAMHLCFVLPPEVPMVAILLAAATLIAYAIYKGE